MGPPADSKIFTVTQTTLTGTSAVIESLFNAVPHNATSLVAGKPRAGKNGDFTPASSPSDSPTDEVRAPLCVPNSSKLTYD